LYGGTGVNANPLFIKNVRENKGYVIDSISLARNKGENLKDFIESKGLPWTDIEGKPRDTSPDLGVYEFSPDGQSNNNPLQGFLLNQNYPNPFNQSTIISYHIPVSLFVTLKVFDILRNEIKGLIKEEKTAGNFNLEFNAEKLSSGIYFYRLSAGTFVETKKIVLIK